MKKRQLFINVVAAVLAVGVGLLLTKFLPQRNPYPVLAEDVHDSGSCGTNATWEFDSQTGLLEIGGSGAISSYSPTNAPWNEYRGYITSLIVSEEITSIPQATFSGLGKLEEITIPFVGTSKTYSSGQAGSLFGFIFGTNSYTDGTYITQKYSSSSSSYFYIPKNLSNVTVTDAYKLSYGAFYGCKMLKEVSVNDDITQLYEMVFYGCSNLEYSNFPSSQTVVPGGYYERCSKLKQMDLPEGLVTISSNAFYGCTSLSEVSFPSTLKTIYSQAFYNCTNIQSLDLPDGLTTIGDSAFYNCQKIEALDLPEGLETIGATAFYNVRLVEFLEVPRSVQTIGSGAFAGMISLKEIKLPFIGYKRNTNNTSGSEYIFGYVFGNAYTSNEVTRVYQKYGSSSSDSVDNYIPSNLKVVTITDEKNIGYGAFYGCSMINELFLNEGILSLGNYAFNNCSSLFRFEIPSTVSSIRSSCFYGCSKLTELVIPDGVTSLPISAFSRCTSLKMIELPEGLTNISNSAFYNCSSLVEVNFPSTIKTIGDSAFYNCQKIEALDLPEGLETIGATAFYNVRLVEFLEVPRSVQTIGSGAFAGMISLKEIKLPFIGYKRNTNNTSGSEYIFGYVFGNAYTSNEVTRVYQKYGSYSSDSVYNYIPSNLKVVTITDEKNIGYGAFYGCSMINELFLNEGIVSVNYQAFYNLRYVDLCTDEFVISGNVLLKYKGDKSVVAIPEGVGVIAPSAFQTNSTYSTTAITKYTQISIPKSVSYVGDYAFYNLTNCTITIPKMSGNLTVKGTAFTNVYVVSYLDTYSYSNGNDTYFYSVSGDCASINKCTTTSAAITLPTSLGGYTVTSVGFKGMANCTSLTSVTIPYTIQELGEYAFNQCTGITTVTIPSTVLIIGNYAFAGCTSLTTVTIAEGVESIGDFAFYGCTKLFEIVIPDTCVYLGSYCFYNCTSLESASIGISVENILPYTFYNCTSLTTVTIGISVESIGDYAFYKCALTRVTTPTSLKHLGDFAFAYNADLNRLTLRNNLETIGAGAFYYCTSLQTVSLPSKITVINDYCFGYCTSLTTFTHSGNLTRIGSFAFVDTLIDTFTFDSGLTFIGAAAFKNTNLSNIYLPNTLVYIGGDAFSGCTHLSEVSMPDSVAHVGSFAFLNNSHLHVTIRYNSGRVADYMLYGSSVHTVTIDDQITVIGNSVFSNCYHLYSVKLPAYLEEIGSRAFYRCYALKTLSVPDTVQSIGQDAFYQDYNIAITITFVNGEIADCLFEEQFIYHVYISNGIYSIGARAFANCPNLIDVSLSDEVETIGELCFQSDENLWIYIRFVDGVIDDYVFQDCNTVTRFFVENGIHTIGEHAFDSCKALQRMDLPNTVQFIDSYAFYDCNSMTYINIPTGVQIINDHVFFGCASLESIDLPNTYKSIEDYAFYGCIKLKQIFISDICTKIGSYAFYNCKSLESINIKDSIKTIGDYAFRSCVLLTEIRIGDNVTSLGMCAFYDCNGLETVYLGKGIYELKDRLFYACVNLTDLYLYAPQAYIDELAFYGAEDVTLHIGHDAYMESYFSENGINYVIDESIIYEYRIVFLDENGDVIYEGTYHYGDTVDIPDGPTKPADNTYIYTFAGWDKAVTAVNGNATYTATYTQTYIEHTVIFYDEDGTVISSQTYHYGDTIIAPANPAKPADNIYVYSFNGWDSEVGTCTGNLEFTATYSRTYIEYTVTFVDENGTVISTQTYHYGDEVEIPANPSKPADNTYTYTFAGWDSAVSQTVVGDATYIATYSKTYIEYTVTFYNEDGTVISTQTYHYGDTIVAPANPTKSADNTYTYSFVGWGGEVSTCTGNMEFQAEFSKTYIEYTVTFYNEDSTVISTQTYHYGDEIEAPADPTKPSDNTYDYIFAGWDSEVGTCSGNMTFTATYSSAYIEYTVTFYNEDGTVLATVSYHYGDEVEVPSNPTKPADNTYTYSFAGWNTAVSQTCTGNATYVATYNRTYIEYTVTFVDENGTIISSETYHYGDTVDVPANPTKPSDNTYSYSFAGWNSEVTTVTGNATYTATYDRSYIEYTVTFVDENGTVISTQTYHYGDEVDIPADPTKAADNTYTYAFAGWDKEIVAVNGDATYTATYNRTYIEYTVTFVDENGTVISSETYHYGDEIESPADPTKPSDNTYDYIFAGWDSEVGTCSGNMTFTATYSSAYIEYTVTFYNEDGTVLATVSYHYGDEIESPLTPTKAADNTYTYTFAGWDNELGTCTGNMSFTATYSSTYIEYTVTFVDENGTVISSETYHYGDEVEVPSNPTKPADNTYTYSFAGWNTAVSQTCTGNATYTATYNRTYIKYTVTFVDENGTVISSETYHYGDEIEAPADPTKPSDNTYDYIFAGWDSEVGTCSGNMTFTATYTKEYSEEYLSGQLRDQLLEEIGGVTDIDLSTYSTIADIESRMSGLADADRATVQAELDKLIQKYNNFVNSINAEFEESVSVSNKWLFGAIVSSISLLSTAAFFLRRRLPL